MFSVEVRSVNGIKLPFNAPKNSVSHSGQHFCREAIIMTLMEWDSNKFDVLVPKMNEQHQKLVAIMNKLYDRADGRAPKPELNALLVELRDWTVKHFREEEDMLQQMKFPQFARHKSIHDKLLEDFNHHYNEFSKGSGQLSPTFFEFLRLWLTSHIMHIDRKYGEFTQQRGAA